MDDEFLVTGHAARLEDKSVRAIAMAEMNAHRVKIHGGDIELLFEFRIERVMHAAYTDGPDTWPPKYAVWKAPKL